MPSTKSARLAVEKASVAAFPTYFVDCTDNPGQAQNPAWSQRLLILEPVPALRTICYGQVEEGAGPGGHKFVLIYLLGVGSWGSVFIVCERMP